MSHIMLIWIQWSGKGTQARKILEHSDNYTLFEMGTELRKFAQSGTPEWEETRRCIEAGLKAPTSAVVKMAELYVTTNKDKKILLDGVIRSQEQNTALEPVFGDFIVIYLDLDVETAVARLGGRRIDPITSETFPVSYKGEFNPKTGNKLVVRTDDTEDAIRSRISWSIADTLPLIDIWESNWHKVYKIDASQSEAKIFAEIEKAIER